MDVPTVNKRDKELLLLLFEEGVLGPSDLVVPMNVSVSTAFRLLEKLEKQGLVEVTANRKRILSNVGLNYVQTLL
jgi:DeoR/GlpR family transcriptional regulator of sugar metabolism